MDDGKGSGLNLRGMQRSASAISTPVANREQAVYQSLVHLTWIDKLLDNVRALFVGLYGEQLKKEHTSKLDCSKFAPYFERQIQDLEGSSDSTTSHVKLTPPSSTDNDSADEKSLKPPALRKPQAHLYDTSADSTPVPTPDTSRPNTPAQHLLAAKGRPGGKMSRRDRKKASAASTQPSSGDEAGAKRKGKGAAKKNRVWGEFGAEEEDASVVLDYSQSDIREEGSATEALEEIKQETWGRKTGKGEFVLKDIDEEMDQIIAAENAKKQGSAASGGIVGSSLGAIGGLFRNVVGGKTLTKEDLAKPLKGMEEHLLKKNVAREAVVRLCESVERDLIGLKTNSFTSRFPRSLISRIHLTRPSNRCHTPYFDGESPHQDSYTYFLPRPPSRNTDSERHWPAVRYFYCWRERRGQVNES